MSPEQARGQADAVDGRTDQFALAAITYRMLTGQEPFHGDDTAAVLYQVVHEDPPPLSLFLPTTWDAAPLQAVLDRALAKSPARRFGGMMELARAFDDAAERTIGAARDGAAGIRPARARLMGAPRLDDAALDTPPPVRTPTPLIVSPPRKLPTPTPTPAPRPAPPLTPAPARPQIIDWEIPSDVYKPRTHARAAVLGLLVLAIAAVLLATGWYRRLPGARAAIRQRIHEWTRPPGGEAAAPAPPAQAAPPDVQPRGGAVNVQPAPESARDNAPPDRIAPAATPERPAAAAPAAPARAPTRRPDAPPAKPRAHRTHAAHDHVRSPISRFTVPPASVPSPDNGAPPTQVPPGATPPLNGKAFEIAPPTTPAIEPHRDLAPSEGDDTPPPAH
jgi:serine/threonine-protein kinase